MADHQAPIGTRDVLPPESDAWQEVIGQFSAEAGRAGYGLLLSPMFEDVEVFARVGEGTDVVSKEMYDLIDKGGRHLALRPEGTASAVRAYVQHRPTAPWKVWYAAPSFRYERPQAGRYRQHHQLGVEALGSVDPDLDVEVIALAHDHLRSVGLTQVTLLLNSMGEPADRVAYAERLRDYLDANRHDLAEADVAKIDTHPLRVLDSKRSESAAVLADAPVVADSVSPDASAHFEHVQAGLDDLGIAFTLTPRLVRGLDYYTRTTFEFQADALQSAQNAVGGGGRYDGLAEALGGPATPGIGFAIGIERVLLAREAEAVPAPTDVPVEAFVVDVTGGSEARQITALLRRAGIGADRAFDQRSMKAQMKAANRSGAALAVIVGEDEVAADTVAVRDMRGDGGQRQIDRAELVATIRNHRPGIEDQ